MIHKVQTYIETNHLLTFDKPVIVGFSGGGDSVSLLFILNRLGYNCVAAHCNFHLRGNESDHDEEFCRKFTEEHQIIFEKVNFDTKSLAAEQHVSIEMAARELRYNWFEAIRKKYDAQAIAVAHHRDDSNETMLLNLMRGTGIRGLCGIRKKNGFIVRPLLCTGKNDLVRFLKENNLPFTTDSSNLSDEYTRNFIRLRLLPLMEEINPSIGLALTRTADHLSDTENIYLHTIEEVKKTTLQKTDNNEFRILIDNIIKQPAPKTILYELIFPFGFTREISDDIFLSLNSESGKIFKAPHSCFKLLKDRDYLIIYKQQEKSKETHGVENKNTGSEDLKAALAFRKVEIDESFVIDKSPYTATFDNDKIKHPLKLRKWKHGDWFIPFGMSGRKKISDFFTDNKFSILEKEKTWLLCCGDDIIWIIGWRTDNRYRIDNNSKYALVVNFS